MRRSRLMVAASCALLAAGCGCGCREEARRTLALRDVPAAYLRVELPDKDVKLDPAQVWEASAITVYSAIFDALYRFDATGRVVPDLARALPDLTEGGKVVRMALREDVPFHGDPCFPDGPRMVRAADVVYSIKRVASPANKDGPWPMLRGRIVGLDDFRAALERGAGSFEAPVAGLQAHGDHELQLTLTKPYPQLLDVLAMPGFGVVPREAVELYGPDFATHPVGSGPFRLESYAADLVVLAAVPSHFRFGDGGTRPAADAAGSPATPTATAPPQAVPGLAFVFAEDKWHAFRAGQLEQEELEPRHWYAYVDRDLALKDDLRSAGYQLHRARSPYVRCLIFNYRMPLLQDVHVRRAIRLAVPWRRLLGDQDICSASLVPRGLGGYVPMDHVQDLARARQELVAAGHPGGQGVPTLLIRYRWFDRELRDAAMVQDALADVGIQSRLVHDEGRAMDGYHLGFQGWSLDFPDASSVFTLFQSAAMPPDGWNHGRYASPEYDALLAAAAGLEAAAARAAAYERLTRFVDDQVVAIPFRQLDDLHALGPRIANFATDPMGYVIWADVRMR